ncbi:MAG TPA: cation transporter [Firmicutes bacterium]|nr:cation transporter [Bacillota bacterium]
MTGFFIRMFVKDYVDTASVQGRERYGKFAGIVGIASNLFLFLLKILIGALSGSIAITADAVNNLSDSASSLITLLGFKLSGKPADAQHPYGHARMEYVTGLIVSFFILFIGFELFRSSVGKILRPQDTEFKLVTILALTVSILLKFWQCLFYRKIARLINSTTLAATAMDSRNDTLATTAVLAAIIISRISGYNLDGHMGAAVALFILVSGVNLVNETISPLLGMAPTNELVERIYKKILSYENIIGLHDLAVHSYGPDRYFASVHCEVSADQDIMVSHDLIDDIERDFLENDGIHLVIHLDPIVTDDERTNELKAVVEELVREISPDLSIHDFRVVWGVSHANLIFDIAVPCSIQWSDTELVELVTERIQRINSTYYPVIMVDHNYVPAPDSAVLEKV